MEEREYPFVFNTQASINLADDDELMQLMVRARFNWVFVGIETPNEKSLAECNKVQNTGRNLVESVKTIHRAGMQVQGGFILGFDNDDQSTFDNMIRFIQESGIVIAMVGLLNAPKRTKLYGRLANENRLLDYLSGDNADLTMNFVPAMGYDVLLKGYQKVVRTIYSDEYYYDRILTCFKSYRPVKSIITQVKYGDIMAFLRSLWRIGITGVSSQ
jgi:radical SAM superfamily enzyme YgiQ (UPF0313 family)